jgi:hypothetical protein
MRAGAARRSVPIAFRIRIDGKIVSSGAAVEVVARTGDRFLLRQHLEQVNLLRRQLEEINQALAAAMKEQAATLARLIRIPGVDLDGCAGTAGRNRPGRGRLRHGRAVRLLGGGLSGQSGISGGLFRRLLNEFARAGLDARQQLEQSVTLTA